MDLYFISPNPTCRPPPPPKDLPHPQSHKPGSVIPFLGLRQLPQPRRPSDQRLDSRLQDSLPLHQPVRAEKESRVGSGIAGLYEDSAVFGPVRQRAFGSRWRLRQCQPGKQRALSRVAKTRQRTGNCRESHLFEIIF